MEDEFHFLFSCPLYQLERSLYYVENIEDIGEFMLKKDEEKLSSMLTDNLIKATGRYVQQIFDKRRTILYKPNW